MTGKVRNLPNTNTGQPGPSYNRYYGPSKRTLNKRAAKKARKK